MRPRLPIEMAMGADGFMTMAYIHLRMAEHCIEQYKLCKSAREQCGGARGQCGDVIVGIAGRVVGGVGLHFADDGGGAREHCTTDDGGAGGAGGEPA